MVGEFIVFVVLVMEYKVLVEDIVRICYVYFIFLEVFKEVVLFFYDKFINF